MNEGNEINKLICKQMVVEESSTMDTNKGGSMRLMRVKLGPTSFFLIRYQKTNKSKKLQKFESTRREEMGFGGISYGKLYGIEWVFKST